MEPIPLRLERSIVDLIYTEQRKGGANRMRWTRLLDLQNRERRLRCELPDQLEFSVSERGHHLNLKRIWTTSVRLPRDNTNSCWKTWRRQ